MCMCENVCVLHNEGKPKQTKNKCQNLQVENKNKTTSCRVKGFDKIKSNQLHKTKLLQCTTCYTDASYLMTTHQRGSGQIKSHQSLT